MGILDSVATVVDLLDIRGVRAAHDAGAGFIRWAMLAATWAGSGWSVLGVVVLAIVPRTRDFGRSLLIALTTQAALVWEIKRLTGRVRPWIAYGWSPPPLAPRDGSFPSGHASGSFCVAAFVVAWIWWSGKCGPPNRSVYRFIAGLGLVVASLVAMSRVVLGAHYPSDVVAGAALGCAIGGLAVPRKLGAGRLGVEGRDKSRY
jgi:undecaprenyl-diphosphatase